MTSPASLPFVKLHPGPGTAGDMPVVPVILRFGRTAAATPALVDSGAACNVLPYDLGLRLGADWTRAGLPVPLAGTLANAAAKAQFVDTEVAPFAPVRLIFAWTRATLARPLLGQTNSFDEFDICFYRARGVFHLQPRTP